jgi:hypothetical protein
MTSGETRSSQTVSTVEPVVKLIEKTWSADIKS